MSTFSFNKIFILESLPSSEFQTGTELEKRLNQWAPEKGIDCQVVTFQVHSMQDWEIAWNGIYTSIEKMGNIPIIHLEMHGNKVAIGIDGGVNGIIPLKDVFQKVQHANVLSQNNVFLSLAVCMGLNVIRSLKVYEPMPFCGVLGSLETLKNEELLENYTIFYKAFLTTLNLDKAKQIMKESGVDATKYELYKPEQIFMNAYYGYLETYKTDEQIVEKAIETATKAGIVFIDEEEQKRFIGDYRCELLMTERQEYQRALMIFFMLDKYPEICKRFVVPQTISNFKQFVGSQGQEWLINKRELTSEDIRRLSIIILKEVDKFCSTHKIQYSLAYGTLLGAVRHKGFIPWDDDIDIMMLREDYDRFIAEFPHDKDSLFSVASYETDKNFRYAFAKVVCNATIKDELGYAKYGLGIDLFPIDKIPKDKDKACQLVRRLKYCWNMFMFKRMRWRKNRSGIKNFFLLVSKPVMFFIPYSVINKMVRIIIQRNSVLVDYYLGCPFTPYREREIMDKDIFEEVEPLPFERESFSGLKQYDRFLTNIYGDYMQLPPEEKRVTHHDFEAYWK